MRQDRPATAGNESTGPAVLLRCFKSIMLPPMSTTTQILQRNTGHVCFKTTAKAAFCLCVKAPHALLLIQPTQ